MVLRHAPNLRLASRVHPPLYLVKFNCAVIVGDFEIRQITDASARNAIKPECFCFMFPIFYQAVLFLVFEIPCVISLPCAAVKLADAANNSPCGFPATALDVWAHGSVTHHLCLHGTNRHFHRSDCASVARADCIAG